MSPTTQELRTAIASIIVQRRKRRGWTQEDFAKFSGVERSFITRIEQAKTTPTMETIFRLALAFKMKPKRLVSEIEDEIIHIGQRNDS